MIDSPASAEVNPEVLQIVSQVIGVCLLSVSYIVFRNRNGSSTVKKLIKRGFGEPLFCKES